MIYWVIKPAFVDHRCRYFFNENIISINVSILPHIGYRNETEVMYFFTNNVMLSVKEEFFMLMDCPGFWLLLWNVICSKHRRTGGNYEKNETEKLSKISYQLNETKSKCIITQLTKNLSKVIVKSTRKRYVSKRLN